MLVSTPFFWGEVNPYTGVHGESKSIDFIDLKTQQDLIRPELEAGIHRVLHHGQYIMGPEVRKLEENLAREGGGRTSPPSMPT